MSQVKVLDCTLRDGGYCNNWCFGIDNIQAILSGLSEAKLDYIECGYLSNKQHYEQDRTVFNSLDDLNSLLPTESTTTISIAPDLTIVSVISSACSPLSGCDM